MNHDFLNQKIRHQDDTYHQGNDEVGLSYQNPLDNEIENIYDESVNLTANVALEEPAQKYIDTISRIDFKKWNSKVKIVIKDFEFEVIPLIDLGTDLNCIREGIIPSKYFQ